VLSSERKLISFVQTHDVGS